MAICHVRTSAGSASRGQSAGAKHDYIHREGKYSRDRAEVEHAESRNMPAWAAGDPRQYWRAADRHERANGRLYVEVQVALPNELSEQQRRALAATYAERLCGGERLPYTVAIHRGQSREAGKPDNPHAHIVISERRNDGIERDAASWFKRANRKSPERGGALKWERAKKLGWAEHVRQEWAAECNQALEAAGRPERIDPRPLAEQAREALERGELERAAELSRDPEPKRGAGDGIERRRQAARERGVPEAQLPAASYAVKQCAEVRAANVEWRAECRQRSEVAEQARERAAENERKTAAVWERYWARWPGREGDRPILEAITGQLERWRRDLRERFMKPFSRARGLDEYAHPVEPKPLPRSLAPQGRTEPGAAGHAQDYADHLPLRYSRKWDAARIVARCREIGEQARNSFRARFSRDPEKYAEDRIRQEVGPQAQRLDREMREDMRRYRPHWGVLQRHDQMRGEERTAENERKAREARERWHRGAARSAAEQARETLDRSKEPDLGPSR